MGGYLAGHGVGCPDGFLGLPCPCRRGTWTSSVPSRPPASSFAFLGLFSPPASRVVVVPLRSVPLRSFRRHAMRLRAYPFVSLLTARTSPRLTMLRCAVNVVRLSTPRQAPPILSLPVQSLPFRGPIRSSYSSYLSAHCRSKRCPAYPLHAFPIPSSYCSYRSTPFNSTPDRAYRFVAPPRLSIHPTASYRSDRFHSDPCTLPRATPCLPRTSPLDSSPGCTPHAARPSPANPCLSHRLIVLLSLALLVHVRRARACRGFGRATSFLASGW